MSEANKFTDCGNTVETLNAKLGLREPQVETGVPELLRGIITLRPASLMHAERRRIVSELLRSQRACDWDSARQGVIDTQRATPNSASSMLTAPLAAKRRIVGYVRSNVRVDEVARMCRNLEAYAQEKYGRHVDAFYVDDWLPGLAVTAPSLRRLMTDAASGSIGIVLMTNADEIPENRRFRGNFGTFCSRLEIKVHTPDYGMPTCPRPISESVVYRGKVCRSSERHDRPCRRWKRALGAPAAARKPIT